MIITTKIAVIIVIDCIISTVTYIIFYLDLVNVKILVKIKHVMIQKPNTYIAITYTQI